MNKQCESSLVWRKSTYSNDGSECIEVTDSLQGFIAVRDSKIVDSQELSFGPAEWARFIGRLKIPNC